VRTLRIRAWILIAGCLAGTAIVYCAIHLRSRAPSNPQAAASAEDEVYETVVRDMVPQIRDKQVHVSQLVFNDAVLTYLTTGVDIKSCEERARKGLQLQNGKPPYNFLSDKIYRALTRSSHDDSLRAETIQDFLEKICTGGRLSHTFPTDLPRTFVAAESVHQQQIRASGIISFSHVGFDSTLHEAILSSSFISGGLCGCGYRYVLRKKSGHWEVVNKLMLWIS